MHTKRVCSFPGCGTAPTRQSARGLCPGHYTQARLGLKLTPILRGESARFWAKVEKTEGCWNWMSTKHAKGYGHFKVKGRTIKAHRWSYEHKVGPIPDGLTIDHLCGNTSCVRPDHLEAVEGAENTLRGGNPCAANARKTHCPRGHEYTPENTYIRPNQTGRACRTCWLAQAKSDWRENMAGVGPGH